jgi:Ca-activated chloride channel family protein
MMPVKFRVMFVVMSCLILVLGVKPLFAAEVEDKTLSPYIWIEDGRKDLDSLPLKSTHVDVTIDAVIAKISVIQTYTNEGSRPINARYIFPASTRAAVHGMRMKIGEKVIAARVAKRKEAVKEFQAAKKEGKSASLLSEERPNVFTMQLANIMPKDTIEIQLDYTELVVPQDGVYEFVYPTVVGPRYSTIEANGASEHHKWIKNPYLKAGRNSVAKFSINVNINAGLAIEDMSCPSHQTDITYKDKSSAVVQLSSLEKNADNRDYILRYRLAGQKIHSGLILSKGESENFFLLMMQPPQRVAIESVPQREYIFVVDVSGSMDGFPLNTAKVLLKELIGNLSPDDRFNVILFAGSASVLAPESIAADSANLKQALELIDRQNGGGGTELYKGLETALKLPRQEGVSRSVVVVSDGYIALEKEVFGLIDQNLSTTNFFSFGIGSSVNRYLIEGLARVGQGEPFIVTDPAEATDAAEKFRRYIESPVLTRIKIQYEDFDVYDVEPKAIPDLFAQRPILICGKWRDQPQGKITLTGLTGSGEFSQTIDLSQTEEDSNLSALPYLWARARLARLMDFNPAEPEKEVVDQVTSLGLTYQLLTPYTSFVAVDETIRNTSQQADDVDQPSPMPKGVSNLAVGSGHMVPEPEMFSMMAIMCILGAAVWLRKKAIKGLWVGRK